MLQRHGGSIPIVSTFLEALEVPVVLAGYGLPDDGPHSPNEKFNLSNYLNGMKTTVRLLERLGGSGHFRLKEGERGEPLVAFQSR